MTTQTLQIEVTDEMIDRAIQRLLTRTTYDEYGDEDGERPSIDIAKIVERRLTERVDEAIGKAAAASTKEVVMARVERILDEGFPTFSQWGERSGTKTLAQVVGGIIFKGDRYSEDLACAVRSQMDRAIQAEVQKHIKSISGDLATSMKEAASEALAKWMKFTLGVR